MQKFKLTPDEVDSQKQGFSDLILLDWEDLKFKRADPDAEPIEGEGSGPVNMTP